MALYRLSYWRSCTRKESNLRPPSCQDGVLPLNYGCSPEHFTALTALLRLRAKSPDASLLPPCDCRVTVGTGGLLRDDAVSSSLHRVGTEGFEPPSPASGVRCSGQAELRSHGLAGQDLNLRHVLHPRQVQSTKLWHPPALSALLRIRWGYLKFSVVWVSLPWLARDDRGSGDIRGTASSVRRGAW